MSADDTRILDPTLTGAALLEYVRAAYAARQLTLPYVPERLLSSVRPLDSEYFFATESSLPLPLDFIPGWVRAIRSPGNDEQAQLLGRDYLLFGEAGHGVNSCFFYYYLHWGQVYLFYNHPFGGIYHDHEVVAARINADQAAIAQAVPQCVERPFAPGEVAVVIADARLGNYSWGLLGEQEAAWQAGALADAFKALSAPAA